jgi:hypothetical protein
MTMPTITEESKLTKQQYKSFGPRAIKGYGDGAAIWCHVRYDDECGNGHNTFAITGTVRVPKQRDAAAGGCLHDDIAEAFPELAKYIKWHLCSSDGPMHYVANTKHFASDRDCWGYAKGEPSAWEYGVRFNGVPVTHRISKKFYDFIQGRKGTGPFYVVAFAHDRDPKTYSPNFSLIGFAEKWHECPFRDKTEAEEFCEALNTCEVGFVKVPTAFSNGKERELDNARAAAIWPDATDEELTAPGLEDRLMARLPKLLEDFRHDMEELGFTW